MKCRGQFVGGRVLCAEVQKANEGHQAWEASQVHTFLHSDWCGTRSLAHSLTHSLTQVDGKEDGRSGCKEEEKKRRKQQQVKPEEETQVSEMVEHVHTHWGVLERGRSLSGGVPLAQTGVAHFEHCARSLTHSLTHSGGWRERRA